MVTPAFGAGERPSAAKFQLLAQYAEYTPALTAATTNPTLGTSPTQTGIVWVTGQLVTVWFEIVFGTGSPTAGSGFYLVGLPVADYPVADLMPLTACGVGKLRDSSAASERRAIFTLNGARTNVQIHSAADDTIVTNAVPWVWAAGDSLSGTVQYLTDYNT